MNQEKEVTCGHTGGDAIILIEPYNNINVCIYTPIHQINEHYIKFDFLDIRPLHLHVLVVFDK